MSCWKDGVRAIIDMFFDGDMTLWHAFFVASAASVAELHFSSQNAYYWLWKQNKTTHAINSNCSCYLFRHWIFYIHLYSPWKVAAENRTTKKERQTDRQTGKQSTDYISQIMLLVNKLTHTLWKHFQQIKRTSNCLIHKNSVKILSFLYESGQLWMAQQT